MQDQRVIDQILFRDLFAELFRDGLGDEDEYRIDASGVWWHTPENEFVQKRDRMDGPGRSETTFYVNEVIRPATLEFPCSPAQALVWARRSARTWAYVPQWLEEALEEPDADGALAVLEAAAATLDEKGELGSLNRAAAAFRTIREKMPAPSVNDAAGGPSGPRTVADFSRLGTDALHAKVRASRDALIADYQAGNFKTKDAAAEALAEKHGFTFQTARDHLKGIPKSP